MEARFSGSGFFHFGGNFGLRAKEIWMLAGILASGFLAILDSGPNFGFRGQ